MPPPTLPVARCLDALLRYEIAAVGSYRSAEIVLAADRAVLAAVHRSHELAAATLHRDSLRRQQQTHLLLHGGGRLSRLSSRRGRRGRAGCLRRRRIVMLAAAAACGHREDEQNGNCNR